MKKTTVLVLSVVLFVFLLTGGSVQAAQAEWRDPAYDFSSPRFVLVADPVFSNDGFDVSGRNKFNPSPYAQEKIKDLLSGKMHFLARHRLVTMDYVLNQIKADPTIKEPFDPKAPGFAVLVRRETGKHVDLILDLDVRDYGWFYEWHEAYNKMESYTERVYYKRKHSDGTESEGWTDVPRTRVVYTPAGYFISDSAAVEFRLYDAKAGKDVWKYSDSRIRKSPNLSNGYDPSGPESMMKRIFEDAFKKMPLAH